MLELWKVVPDYPNYKISSFGRVEKHGKISDFSNRNGDYYLSEYMGNESGSIIKYVHVLVAELFIGEKPSPLHIVNHKDRNKRNNRVDNLEYLTKSENSKHWLTVGNQSKNIPDHSKQVMIIMPKELVRKVEEMAAAESRSRSNMLRVLIEQGIKHGETKSKLETS